MSSRHLLPVALSLCLGAAFFLYWRESGQLQTSRHSHRLLQRELTASRSERDQVQFRLNLLREDLEAAQQAREEGERRVQELDEQLQEERGKLVRERGRWCSSSLRPVVCSYVVQIELLVQHVFCAVIPAARGWSGAWSDPFSC